MTAEGITGERSKGEETGETGGIQENSEVSKGSVVEYLVGKKAFAVSLEN